MKTVEDDTHTLEVCARWKRITSRFYQRPTENNIKEKNV